MNNTNYGGSAPATPYTVFMALIIIFVGTILLSAALAHCETTNTVDNPTSSDNDCDCHERYKMYESYEKYGDECKQEYYSKINGGDLVNNMSLVNMQGYVEECVSEKCENECEQQAIDVNNDENYGCFVSSIKIGR